MVLFSLLVIFCSYRFGCLIKDSIVSSCSHNFSFPHFSINCHFFSCLSILRVLANSYQNVVSIMSILHRFCRHKHNLYRVTKKRPHNCKIVRKNASTSCARQTENLTIFKKTLLLLGLVIVVSKTYICHM